MSKRFWFILISTGVVVSLFLYFRLPTSPGLTTPAKKPLIEEAIDNKAAGDLIFAHGAGNAVGSQAAQRPKEAAKIDPSIQKGAGTSRITNPFGEELPLARPLSETDPENPVITAAQALLSTLINTAAENNTYWLHTVWDDNRQDTDVGAMPEHLNISILREVENWQELPLLIHRSGFGLPHQAARNGLGL